jgi:phosphoribosylglycinamide formyltransferase-1
MKKIVILISGRGSNLRAILEARPPFHVAAVISNVPQAAGLEIARERGVETCVVDHRTHLDRATFEIVLAQTIDTFVPDLIVLAGFMRVLTATFVNRYAGRIINIHPSLLPALPGMHTHRQALTAGLKVHGCTVHFVTPRVDFGPIIIQAAVPVLPYDDENTLAARVLAQEHRVYPQAIRWFCKGQLILTPTGTVTIKGARETAASLLSPALDA